MIRPRKKVSTAISLSILNKVFFDLKNERGRLIKSALEEIEEIDKENQLFVNEEAYALVRKIFLDAFNDYGRHVHKCLGSEIE